MGGGKAIASLSGLNNGGRAIRGSCRLLSSPNSSMQPWLDPHPHPYHSPEGLNEVEIGKLVAVHKGL